MAGLLERLAEEVGVNERTLRRAAGSGLIHTQRFGPRRISLPEPEVAWVRAHWSVVARLRAALRTEQNVALAVLFGSLSRGDDVPGVSDVDLLVDLRNWPPGALPALRGRLAERLGRDVELVPLQAAQRDRQLMEEVLRDGRPLVDRADLWASLQAQRDATQRRAGSERRKSRDEARRAVDYFRRLAAQVAPPQRGSQR